MPKKSKAWALMSFIFMLCFSHSFGQSPEIDSLEKELQEKELPDSSRMEVLLQLGWDLAFFNGDSSRLYLNQCIDIATQHHHEINIGTAYSYIGNSYFQTDVWDSALHYFQIAETHFLKDTSAEAKENVIVNRMSMGTVALQQSRHETAIGYYLKVIDYIEKIPHPNDWKNLATAYANIGLVYNDLKQYGKALNYHLKAIGICKQHPEELGKTAQIQMLIALDLLNLKKFNEVMPALDTAEIFLKEIHSDHFYTTLYALKGRYFNELKDYQQAISFSEKALAYAEKNNQKFQKANILYQLGISYYSISSFSKSLHYFLPALQINRELKDKIRELASLNYLAKAYTQSNNFKEANQYYQQYISLNDSLHQAETQKKINEIENKYQAEKKQAAITALQKDIQLQKSALKQRRTVNLALLAGCVLLLLLALVSYINFKNKNSLLLQKQVLHTQQINEMEKERKLIAVQSVLQGQEEERSRLAKDLHDGVGGLLSGIKLSMSTMQGNVFLSEQNAQAFGNVLTQLDQSIAELRRVSHNMMPEALIKYGLKEALENYCENLNLSGKLKVQLQTYGMEVRMEQNTEIILYRIVQELLNNIIKHADATNVLIQLALEQEHFNLTVEDDGKGFDTNNVNDGAGLANIKARAEYLNGSVDIISKKGEGTSINIVGTASTQNNA